MRVSELYIHPVKSACSVAVSEMTFDGRGPIGDRRYMVIGADGLFRTQRNLPAMTRLAARIDSSGNLLLTAHGFDALTVAPPAAPLQTAHVWDSAVPVRDCGDTVAHWLTRVLREPCRLVRQGADGTRPIRRLPAREVSLADGYPLLLLSAAALTDLGARLGRIVEARRFRPNIVVEGCAPHAEDGWRRVRIGANTFTVAQPCERCSIPALDPQTGIATSGFNRALAKYRTRDRKVLFGQNLVHEGEAAIAVGDEVEVLEALA